MKTITFIFISIIAMVGLAIVSHVIHHHINWFVQTAWVTGLNVGVIVGRSKFFAEEPRKMRTISDEHPTWEHIKL